MIQATLCPLTPREKRLASRPASSSRTSDHDGASENRSVSPKINLRNVASFSSRTQTNLSDHIHHTFHHNLTIKTPHPTLTFRLTPIKKRPSNLEKTVRRGASVFFLTKL